MSPYDRGHVSRLSRLEGLFAEWASTQWPSGSDVVCRCEVDGCGTSRCARLVSLLRLDQSWPTCHGRPMTLELVFYDEREVDALLASGGQSLDALVRAARALTTMFLKVLVHAPELTWTAFVGGVRDALRTLSSIDTVATAPVTRRP